MKFETTTDKYIYLVKNWDNLTNIQLARELNVKPGDIAKMANTARNNGIKLSIKTKRRNTRAIDWKQVQQAFEGGDSV